MNELSQEQLKEKHSLNILNLKVGDSYKFQTKPKLESAKYSKISNEETKEFVEYAKKTNSSFTVACLICSNNALNYSFFDDEYREIYSKSYVCVNCNYDINYLVQRGSDLMILD